MEGLGSRNRQDVGLSEAGTTFVGRALCQLAQSSQTWVVQSPSVLRADTETHCSQHNSVLRTLLTFTVVTLHLQLSKCNSAALIPSSSAATLSPLSPQKTSEEHILKLFQNRI